MISTKRGTKQYEIKPPLLTDMWKNRWLYIIMVPGLAYFLIYKYLPMLGLVMVFQDYKPIFGITRSQWVGLKHFYRLFTDPSFFMLFRNTLIIAVLNLVLYFPFTILLALLLNEVRAMFFKRFIQSVTYMPHFLSWVVIASLTYKLLSQEVGIVSGIMKVLGKETIPFLSSRDWFRSIIVIQGIWRDLGWGSIIFLAAIAGIEQEMYEAAIVEGATRLQNIWYVTLPSIKPTIITILILRLGRFLELGFEQIIVQINPMNRAVGEIFDTYIYTMGVVGGQYSYNTAVGMFKALVGAVLVIGANIFAKRLGEEGVY
jgi:putative aldouronate transport system permease protein